MRTAGFDIELAFLRITRRKGRMIAGVWTVAIASAAVFFILSLGNGLEAYFSDRLRAFTPALWVEDVPQRADVIAPDIGSALAAYDGVSAVSKTVEATVLASRGDSSAGAKLTGYEADKLDRVLPITKQSVAGRLPQASGEAAIGVELAHALGVHVGDTIQLTGASGHTASALIVGLLHAGFAAVDAALVLTTFETASDVASVSGRYGYALQIEENVDLEALRLKVQADTGRWTQTWYEGRRALLEAMEVQSNVMFWISLAAVAAAALGSSGVAVLRAAEQRPESGILLALGASRANLLRTALAESAWGACAAAVAGAGIGLVAVLALGKYPVQLPSAFGLEYLPLQPSWPDFLLSAGLTVGATTVASIFPALRAANADPADVLRER